MIGWTKYHDRACRVLVVLAGVGVIALLATGAYFGTAVFSRIG